MNAVRSVLRFCRLKGNIGWLVVGSYACSPPPPAATPSVPPPTASATVTSVASVEAVPPLPQLAVGVFAPIEHPTAVPGHVALAEQSGDIQTLWVQVPHSALPPDAVPTLQGKTMVQVKDAAGLELVSVAEATPSPVTAAAASALATAELALGLWIRRRASAPTVPSSAQNVLAEVYTEAGSLGGSDNKLQPGHHFQVAFSVPERLAPNPKLVDKYLRALELAAPPQSPVHWLLQPDLPPSGRALGSGEQVAEWSNLMRITSGYESIEAALATQQSLRASVSPRAATVPFNTLQAPQLTAHPWPQMLTAVPGPTPAEGLAALVPAEFYFVRARSFDTFQTLIDRVDEVVTPAVRMTTNRRESLELTERYRLELGLPNDELSRLFGAELIHSLVVTGSDPLLRQGSDVSVLLQVPSIARLQAALAVKRAALAEHFPLQETSWTHEGVQVNTFVSAQGHVRQHFATHTAADGQQYVLVSNSPGATRRIITTWVGKGSKLSDELDFQYMLRRDAQVKHDVLVYMGDKFVAEVVSPRQRILESRRQLAKAELMSVGYSALLYGQVFGRLPADSRLLSKQSWCPSSRFKHTSGDVISYEPASGPRSMWGTAARLTSIIDLPTPARVSKVEQDAYQAFAQNYERRWGENIDPIAIRVTTSASALDAHVRVLPLVNIGDYAEIARFSGGGSTAREASVPALSGILAIGQKSELRTMLSRQGESFLGRQLKLDWLGDWAELGLADDPALAKTALEHGDFPAPPNAATDQQSSDFSVLAELPLYLVIDIKSVAGATVLLTLLRELASDAAPGVVKWQTLKQKQATDHAIVHVQFEDVSLYYCLTKKQLVFSPHLPTLERLLNREHSAEALSSKEQVANGESGQLVVDLAPTAQGSALRAVASWFAELGIREAGVHSPLAELLLRGAAGTNSDPTQYRTVALAHLGGVPVTAEGQRFSWLPSGLSDPARGTIHAPVWPSIPVKGGPVEHFLQLLKRLRTQVSVDTEPGPTEQMSLRTRVRLEHH